MAVIIKKHLVGSEVKFSIFAFRSFEVREWEKKRDRITVEKQDGPDVWVINNRTGQVLKVDSTELVRFKDAN